MTPRFTMRPAKVSYHWEKNRRGNSMSRVWGKKKNTFLVLLRREEFLGSLLSELTAPKIELFKTRCSPRQGELFEHNLPSAVRPVGRDRENLRSALALCKNESTPGNEIVFFFSSISSLPPRGGFFSFSFFLKSSQLLMQI